MSLAESKATLKDFYKKLDSNKRRRDFERRVKEDPSTKMRAINQECDKLKEDCIQGIFAQIYRDALPMDQQFKATRAPELENGVLGFIRKRAPKGSCYRYIAERAKTVPQAGRMLEAVTESVNDYTRRVFFEGLDEKDVDDIQVPETDKSELIGQISKEMDYPQISQIIQANVQKTIQAEAEAQKAEQANLEALQKSLSEDETVATESAVDAALWKAGYGKQTYVPGFFTGIMIGKVDAYTESGLEGEDLQKKAFYESVKEITKYAMLDVLGMEQFDERKINTLATRYARGEM